MTPLGLLNFIVMQWFGVRLEATITTIDLVDVITGETFSSHARGRWWSRNAPREGIATWRLIHWIWPLTGWWSTYRYMGRVDAFCYLVTFTTGVAFLVTQLW